MRAFIHELDATGRILLGSDHATITREYKTFSTMYRYAIRPFLKRHNGRAKVEIFYHDFETRKYGEPDRVQTYNTHIFG